MKRRNFIGLSTAAIVGTLGGRPSVLQANNMVSANRKISSEKELNPNTKWLREAKWGLFTHYLAHTASTKVPEDMNGKLWNKKVNSFQVKQFGKQLSELKAPYFFITIGQGGGYYCSPNNTYERLFGPSDGKLSERDLVAELIPRGIRMCVYLPAVGRRDFAEKQKMWQQVITEWSERWGKSISAWWIDGGVFSNPSMYIAYTNAFKAGNPESLIAYNTDPLGMNPAPKLPATEYEDYLAGECNWHLPVSGSRPWDNKEYYLGPNISGDQLHFLNFLGNFWGQGAPRFPDELVIGWTKHTNNHGGSISWDVPLSDSGIISEKCFKQIKALSNAIKKGL